MATVIVIPLHITPTENARMPVGPDGAYMRCYSSEQSVEMAIKLVGDKLKADGMNVEEILEPIEHMDSSQWILHINDLWPEHVSSLMIQEEFDEAMSSGEIVCGPLEVYSPQ